MVGMIVDIQWHVETDVSSRGGDIKVYIDVASNFGQK